MLVTSEPVACELQQFLSNPTLRSLKTWNGCPWLSNSFHLFVNFVLLYWIQFVSCNDGSSFVCIININNTIIIPFNTALKLFLARKYSTIKLFIRKIFSVCVQCQCYGEGCNSTGWKSNGHCGQKTVIR